MKAPGDDVAADAAALRDELLAEQRVSIGGAR